MTTQPDLTALRSAIVELAGAPEIFHNNGKGWLTFHCLLHNVTETLAASAEKGETDPNQIAARITDILRETETRLGIRLTKGGES